MNDRLLWTLINDRGGKGDGSGDRVHAEQAVNRSGFAGLFCRRVADSIGDFNRNGVVIFFGAIDEWG